MDLLKSIFKGDKVIWIIFLFLCLISITEVFSAASTLTYKSGDHWGPITQHSIILMVGAVIVVLMHNIPYKWFQVFPVFLLPASAILLILVMMMERINGAARWMTFMGIQFQPSEIAKMAVIIVTAFILSKGQDEDGANPKAFKRIMIITGVICLLIAPENLSTAALLFGVVFLMMFIGRVSAKRLLMLTSYTDTGTFCIYFGCDPKDADLCTRLVYKELKRLRDAKMTSSQLAAAKKQLIGQIGVASDNNENNALGMAKTFLHYNKYETAEAVFRRIGQLTPEILLEVANEMFAEDYLSTLVYD